MPLSGKWRGGVFGWMKKRKMDWVFNKASLFMSSNSLRTLRHCEKYLLIKDYFATKAQNHEGLFVDQID